MKKYKVQKRSHRTIIVIEGNMVDSASASYAVIDACTRSGKPHSYSVYVDKNDNTVCDVSRLAKGPRKFLPVDDDVVEKIKQKIEKSGHIEEGDQDEETTEDVADGAGLLRSDDRGVVVDGSSGTRP